ncbi:hypothetical protein [Methylobacterium sp. SD21]|uniref:hypothetical protein n=1 Tax=Methylobacterium litchii TaxID=3138810 RepID=UPI00313C37C3
MQRRRYLLGHTVLRPASVDAVGAAVVDALAAAAAIARRDRHDLAVAVRDEELPPALADRIGLPGIDRAAVGAE